MRLALTSEDKTNLGGSRDWLREPLLHFLLLAGLLFVLKAAFIGDDREEIVVDAATQEFLLNREAQLTLRTPTEADRERLIEDFVDEEILVREAMKRGFADSSRVRALLIQNMRFFVTGDISEPTEEELRAFYEANRRDFESPPSVDLEHVYFEDPAAVPATLLDQLNAGADPTTLGDLDLIFGTRLRYMDTRRLSGAFGAEGAREILAIGESDATWHGPIVAPHGTAHFVRVAARNDPQVPAFDEARDWIATQWVAAKAREAMEAELSGMRRDYRVTIDPVGGE